MDKFINLHVHSEYSLLDGYGHPADFVQRAKALGQSALALTDHGNVSGHFKFYEACKKQGIKPILGCELYVSDDITVKTREYYHITVLAKNLVGYRNLMQLVTKAWNDGFYYKPKVDWAMLKQHSAGLIATTGCPAGKLGVMIEKRDVSIDTLVEEIKRQQSIFDELYLEIAPWEFAGGQKIARRLMELKQHIDVPMIITSDAHYPAPEDAKVQDMMLCIQTNTKFNDLNRMRFDNDQYFLKSGEEVKNQWNKLYPDLAWRDEFIDNTQKIAESVDFEFPKATPISYVFEGDKNNLLMGFCVKGLQERGLADNKLYWDRLHREIALIIEKKFVDYFLVVADLIGWAKQQGIMVGPGRGSSGGSLVCYLMHITEIDPIEHGLLFERFIDVNRSDLPDIDIDFEDERREEVKQYLTQKYGAGNVATLSTWGTFQGRLCLQDVGRVFGVPTNETEEIKRLIVQRSGGDSRFGYSVEDAFNNFEKSKEVLDKYPELRMAQKIEGQIRQMGVHAAGFVVSNEPIENFAAIYKTPKGDRVCSMDYHDASTTGLLKIDLLGLTAMTIIKHTLQKIQERTGERIDLYKIPLDDQAVYKAFQEGKLFGVFQFDGKSLIAVCQQLKPENFEQLAAVNAISRPGPLHSMTTQEYIDRRFGKKPVVFLHSSMESITAESYGLTIYQEQVMNIVKNIGNFTWEETSTIRKIMSKNVGEEAFNRYKEKFLKGAAENGVELSNAEKIWAQIFTHGSWSYNKSHCVAYTLIGYWMQWFKVHHPLEFYSSLLVKEDDEGKIKRILKEFKNEGHAVLPVDVNKSALSYTIEDQGLRLGFLSVKGIGNKVAQKVISSQPFSNLAEFKSKINSEKTEQLLNSIGAMRELFGKNEGLQTSLFGTFETIVQTPALNDLLTYCPAAVEDTIYKRWHAKSVEYGQTLPTALKNVTTSEDTVWRQVVVVGRTNPKEEFNPKNKVEEKRSRGEVFTMEEGKKESDYDFLNFNLEDETDFISVRVQPDFYKQCKNMIWATQPTDELMIEGSVIGNMRMLFAKKIVNLTQGKVEEGAVGKSKKYS